jgi:hypothetical protein
VLWIFVMMFGLVGFSILAERVLPLAVKDRLGTIICWGMMFVTMSFLTLSTVGLVIILVRNVVLPLLA